MSKPNNNTPCPECNGFGMVHDRWTATNEVCPDCNGTGRKSSNQTDNFEAKNGNKESSDAIKTSGRKSEPTIYFDEAQHITTEMMEAIEKIKLPESEPVRDCPTPDSPGVVFHQTVNDTSWIGTTFNKPEANLTLEPESEIEPDLDQILRKVANWRQDEPGGGMHPDRAKQAIESLITEAYKRGHIDGSFNNLDGLKGEL